MLFLFLFLSPRGSSMKELPSRSPRRMRVLKFKFRRGRARQRDVSQRTSSGNAGIIRSRRKPCAPHLARRNRQLPCPPPSPRPLLRRGLRRLRLRLLPGPPGMAPRRCKTRHNASPKTNSKTKVR